MNAAIECMNVNRSFGRTEAVRNLDLILEENVIYGLLGRNGAGKTTLLNMITGSSFPDSGTITVAGQLLRKGDIPASVCYVREKNLFFSGARVKEIMELAAIFHANWDWDFAYELARIFKLDLNKKIGQLSRGMESLVGNVVGFASRASITIFDEPVLGLDVLMRERFYRTLLEDYADNPRTILLSTHLIDEVAKVVEQVYIMDAGKILLKDDVDNIRLRSHMIKGNHEAVQRFTSDKRVIYQESHGNATLAAVYDTLRDEDKASAAKQGITIESLPLQKFFSYMIEWGDRSA